MDARYMVQVLGEDIASTRLALARFFGRRVRDEVEDLVQQTMVRAVESDGRLEQSEAARAYLFSIARRVLFAHLRSRDRTAFAESARDDCGANDTNLDPELELLARMSVSRLPRDVQEIVAMSYWDGMSRGEIAGALGLPTGTVASRLRRAIGLLRGHEEGGNDA